MPTLGQLGPLSRPDWRNLGQIWSISLGFDQRRANFVQVGPNLAQICRHSTGFGQIRPSQHRAKLGPNSAQIGPHLARFGQTRGDVGQIWANFGRSRPTMAKQKQNGREHVRGAIGKTITTERICKYAQSRSASLPPQTHCHRTSETHTACFSASFSSDTPCATKSQGVRDFWLGAESKEEEVPCRRIFASHIFRRTINCKCTELPCFCDLWSWSNRFPDP